MPGSKLLFVSYDGLIADIAWQVTREGNKAKLWIQEEDERGIADGFAAKSSSKDAVILFKSASREGYHIEDVRQENGEWLVTGTSGVVLIVCGTGPTMKLAQRQAYNRVRNVMIPNMYYREDIGDRWSEEDSDRLHSWGYLRD